MEASESPRFMGQPPTPPDGALQGFSVVKQEEEKSFTKYYHPTPGGTEPVQGNPERGVQSPQWPLTLCTEKLRFPGQPPHPDWTPHLAKEGNLKHSGI